MSTRHQDDWDARVSAIWEHVAELDRHLATGHSRDLHDEARATLALTYLEQGRATEAAGLALSALAPRLSRYNRSMTANAARWAGKTWN
ncbi:MAG: tetratricopeptide repeat protein [Ramlibacter sp.]